MGVAHPATMTTPQQEVLAPGAGNNFMMGSGSQGQGVVGPMDGLGHMTRPVYPGLGGGGNLATWQKGEGMTRDFLGLAGEAAAACVNVGDLISLRGVDFGSDRDHSPKTGFGAWG